MSNVLSTRPPYMAFSISPCIKSHSSISVGGGGGGGGGRGVRIERCGVRVCGLRMGEGML